MCLSCATEIECSNDGDNGEDTQRQAHMPQVTSANRDACRFGRRRVGFRHRSRAAARWSERDLRRRGDLNLRFLLWNSVRDA